MALKRVSDEAILDMKASGMTTKEIAIELGQTSAYVGNRLARISRRGGSGVADFRTRRPPLRSEDVTKGMSKAQLRDMLDAAMKNTKK